MPPPQRPMTAPHVKPFAGSHQFSAAAAASNGNSLFAAPPNSNNNNNAVVATTTHSPTAAGVNERLSNVRESLAHLSDTIHGVRNHDQAASKARMLDHTARFAEAKDHATRIEQHLAIEVKRRVDADKEIAHTIEQRAREIAGRLEKKMTERLLTMHHTVDVLTKKVEKLTHELAVEREKNVRLTQELKFHSAQGLQDVQHAVEQEKVQRMEKEALLAKKIAEDVFRIQERLDVERHARETMLTSVRDDMGKFSKSRQKADQRYVQNIHHELEVLRGSLKSEQDCREQGEEHLAAALEDVVHQVRSGLAALAK